MMVIALLVAGALLAAPILAIIALVRVQRLAARPGAAPDTDLDRRLASIERRLGALEHGVRSAADAARAAQPTEQRARPVATASGPAVPEQPPRVVAEAHGAPPVARPPQPVVPPPHAAGPAGPAPAPPRLSPVARPSGLDLESLIAGRWLNRVGIVALLLAVAFFLKFAFDNDWIGPAGRVALGLVAGAALLVYGQWLAGRGYTYFSEGIAATGAGTLYLSLYAAWGFYELVPQGVAFAGMIVVTAGLVALAVGRDSERLALLGLLGGLMTPGVLYSGSDRQVVLFCYLAVLNGGVLAVARARGWRLLAPLALAGTLIYYVSWHARWYDERLLGRTLFFATLLFAEFAALPVLRAWRERALFPEHYAVVLANAGWYTIVLHVLLWSEHRWGLTLAVLALALAHLALVRALPGPADGGPVPVRLLYAGLALTFVTIAVPIRLEGEWITMAWAVEAALLVHGGLRAQALPMRSAAFVLFVLVIVLLVGQDIDAARTLLNARLATFATAIGACGVACWLARRHADRLTADEPRLFGALAIGASALAVWGLSLEVWDTLGRSALAVDPRLAQQLGLSVFWAAWATGLIVAGVRRGVRVLRWQGLVLVGMAVCKVFLFDLNFLERAYRILSFLALGVVLLVISFLYQRRLFGEGAGTKP